MATDRSALRLELYTAALRGEHQRLRIRVTGYEMSWTAGNLWSGGEYGPEASVLTFVVLVLPLLVRVEDSGSPAGVAPDRPAARRRRMRNVTTVAS